MTAPATTLVATDLDRTMIYSRAASAADLTDGVLCVEWLDGQELSYLTARSAELLRDLTRRAAVVPVTTRTVEQYQRIDLPGGPHSPAVVANGGTVLWDGTPDPEWIDIRGRRMARDRAAALDEVAHVLFTGILIGEDTSWIRKRRIADGLFCYLVVEPTEQPADALAILQLWAGERGWNVSQQGRKIYAMPNAVDKASALAYVRERLIADNRLDPAAPLLAAGDGALDAVMLEAADRAIRPAHGELHQLGWTSNGLTVTTVSGIAAGEQILDWFHGLVGPVAADTGP